MNRIETTVRELRSKDEWLDAYPVLRQLGTHLDPQSYLQLLKEMREQGYRMFALTEGKNIIAVAGVIVLTTLYNGRFLFVCDLVTREDRRSEGFGARLLDELHRWAKEQGCRRVELSSGLQRRNAHRFYEQRMGYTRESWLFRKNL